MARVKKPCAVRREGLVGTDGIDVDVLVITRKSRKRVDHRLVNPYPMALTNLPTDGSPVVRERKWWLRHMTIT